MKKSELLKIPYIKEALKYIYEENHASFLQVACTYDSKQEKKMLETTVEIMRLLNDGKIEEAEEIFKYVSKNWIKQFAIIIKTIILVYYKDGIDFYKKFTPKLTQSDLDYIKKKEVENRAYALNELSRVKPKQKY